MAKKVSKKFSRKFKLTKKYLNPKKIYFYVFAFILFFSGTIYLAYSTLTLKPATVTGDFAPLSSTTKNIYYPKQYSDSHITENAKISDFRFRDKTFGDSTSLLANFVSSLKQNPSIPQNLGPENGSWLWTPILDITPSYRDSVILGAKKNGIKNLYLSIDSYLDIYIMENGPEKDKRKAKFDAILAEFVTVAKANGMTVDFEAGWRNWAEMGNSYKAFATLNYAIDFNKTHINKIRGFQYDIEPYLLEYYETSKKSVLGNFVNLIDESVARLDDTDLILTVVVPEFYDNTNEDAKIYYAGQNLYTIEQLLRVLDKREGSKIIVMSYRNFSLGENGSIDISKEEINTANNYNTKIVIAQETGQVDPSYVTFWSLPKSHYATEIDIIKNAFINDKSFDGIATHYVNAMFELK